MERRPSPRANVVEFAPYRAARARRSLPLLDVADAEALPAPALPLAAVAEVRELTDAEVAHRRQMLKHLGLR